jgi:hypothetical protein
MYEWWAEEGVGLGAQVSGTHWSTLYEVDVP